MTPHPTRILLPGLALAVSLASIAVAASAQTPQEQLLARYAAEAEADGSWAGGFSAERGRAFFLAQPGGGKPETPSCTSCHTDDPLKAGRTRAGKQIAPMALSKTPDRFSDPAKVEKWFRRNCSSVLGRTCTAGEKGDFLTFMISQ